MAEARRRRDRPPVRDGFDQKRVEPSDYDVKTSAPYLIAMAARLQAHLYSLRTAECGVSLAGAFLLTELSQEEPLSHSELTTRLSLAHTTVAQTLKRLEQGGFVERSVNEADRRQVRVRLTEAGRAVCVPLKVEGDVLEAEIISLLGPEREEAFRQCLAELAAHYRAAQK